MYRGQSESQVKLFIVGIINIFSPVKDSINGISDNLTSRNRQKKLLCRLGPEDWVRVRGIMGMFLRYE